MNMFKTSTAKTPEEYIEILPEETKPAIQKLHALIKKTVPHLKSHIMAGMIAYGTYHYKYPSGREGDWCIIGLAQQKNYISVYVCASDGKGYVAEKYKSKLPKANIGKSCIRFKKIEDIDLDVLVEVIKEGDKVMTKAS